MQVVDYKKLRKVVKPNLISQEAYQFAHQLIQEYEIANDTELTLWLGQSQCKTHHALRLWVQCQLPLLDNEQTSYERYRQLRHLFQQAIPDFM